MSKRSSRRKRQQQQKKQEARLTGPVLIERGAKAFKQGLYDEAINAWEQACHKGNVPPNLPAAIAEAHFRRAWHGSGPQLADLRQAVQLKPADARYRYHLALAHHRLGQLDQAEPIYRQLLAESPPFERAAMPLGQLLIEKKKALTNDPVWACLSPAAQTVLAAAEALIKRKADSTLQRLVTDNSLDPLWRGLLAVALGDRGMAQQNLQAALAAPEPGHTLTQGVARYYLGVLAATTGQTEQALEHWRAARANGLDTPHLRQNLSVLAYQQALVEQQAGRPAEALKLLEQVNGASPETTALYDQLNLELGYAAAQRGSWDQALRHWQAAENAGATSRSLLLNLALAYQKLDKYDEAAERWRQLLRSRPRKANHPEALSDEQVARIWQNVAENYNKAGDYEEAVKTYKNAVKWAPDNIDLRLKLVETFLTDGRWQAAENELHRILDKQPDSVPALSMLAEIYMDDYYPDRARNLWLRVLELEPQNPIARQQLAFLYERQGNSLAQWGMWQKALEIYQEGLRLVPDSQRLHTVIGGTYASMKKFAQARQYFERALSINPNDLQTLYTMFQVWLKFNSEPDLDQTFDRIKAITAPVPSSFFLDLIDQCLAANQVKRALTLLAYTEARYPDDEGTLLDLAMFYNGLEEEGRAASLLRRILRNNPNHAQANLHLGGIYYQMGQTRLAHRHWDKAEQQARQEKNQMLLYELKTLKDMLIHGREPPRSPLEMLRNMPPELAKQMIDQLPPEIAGVLQNMDPEMLEALLGMAALEEFDEDEEEDEYGW